MNFCKVHRNGVGDDRRWEDCDILVENSLEIDSSLTTEDAPSPNQGVVLWFLSKCMLLWLPFFRVFLLSETFFFKLQNQTGTGNSEIIISIIEKSQKEMLHCLLHKQPNQNLRIFWKDYKYILKFRLNFWFPFVWSFLFYNIWKAK